MAFDTMQLMIDKPWVSVLVLTRNEALHIQRCIRSALRLTSHVFVVDSHSADGTAELARNMGATVISGDFESFSTKLNWSLSHLSFPTPWVIRLDADEIFTEALLACLQKDVVNASSDVNGFYLRRQLWFMERWMKHGGMYPTFSMRLWRPNKVRCESRALDEHMLLLSGTAVTLSLDIIDNPLYSLSTWIAKHNEYSTLEANFALDACSVDRDLIVPSLFGTAPQRRRWLKENIFYQLPLFVRPLLYFFYRYLLKLGFLDGRIGFIFHFMHGFWYRCLVDAKILERAIEQQSPKQ